MYITKNHDCLEQEITQHGNYLTVERHVITQGMEKRKPWTEQMKQITKDLSNLSTMIYNNSIPYTNVNIGVLESMVSIIQDLLQTVIANIEEADREQRLFPDQPTTIPRR